MSALEQIVLAFQGLAHALKLMLRPALWAPWLPVLALELGVIGGLWWFAHPALSWLVAPWLQRALGEEALHYPSLFRLMPGLCARANLLIGSLAGAVAMGASTALFGAWFHGRPLPPREGLRRGLRRAGALIVANLPATLLGLGFSLGLEFVLERRGGPAILVRALPLLTFSVSVALQAFFLWVNPLLMLGQRSLGDVWASLREAARIAPWTALTLSGLAALPRLPIQLATRAPGRIIDHATPESVGWLMVAQTLIVLVTAFALTGGSALAYQGWVGPTLDEVS